MIVDYNKVVNLVTRQLDERVARGELIASNIANVDTPGYKSEDLQFGKVLSSEMESINLKKTHPKHIDDNPSGLQTGQIVENPNPVRPDGNNVDIHQEILKLTKNSLEYNGRVALLARRMGQIKDSINLAK